jgi:hypothetical protein
MTPTPDGFSSASFSAAVADTAWFSSEKSRPFASLLSKHGRFRIALSWLAVYVAVRLLTGAFFMADTVDYGTDVYHRFYPPPRTFWDFGQLLWRPLGWVLFRILTPAIERFTTPDPWTGVIHICMNLNWLAGLGCVLLLRACLHRFSIPPTIANFCTLAFLFSNAFLNYIHSGSPYVPGLTFLLVGLYLLAGPVETTPSPWRPVWAAGALALAVLLWFPCIFAVPGILATPLFYRGDSHYSRALALRTTIYCLIAGLVTYGLVIVGLGLYTPDGIFRWAIGESTPIVGVQGTIRALFALGRSFINMGDDSVLFKRFLLHDPYNPVSFVELVRVSLIKLLLFFGLLIVVLKQLYSANRRIFWLFLAVAAPVFAFGLFNYGGDIERYLPVYPVFFIAVGSSLTGDRAPAYLKWLAAVVLLVGGFSNFNATSIFTLGKERQHVQERLKDVLPLLNSSSRVIVLDVDDEIQNFKRSYPFLPVVRYDKIRTYAAVNVGTSKDLHWQRDLGRFVLKTWGSGGDIWVSTRVLEARPQRDWKWVEGADSHVTWSMLRSFFTEFDYGRSAGGEDGFLLLPPTEKNKAIISSIQDGDAAMKLTNPMFFHTDKGDICYESFYGPGSSHDSQIASQQSVPSRQASQVQALASYGVVQ